MEKLHYNIFISCKSEDYTKAEPVYHWLKTMGHNPFFAPISLKISTIHGEPVVFGDEIDAAIEEAENMIVFTSKSEYVETGYVKDEWRTFVEEQRAGRKSGSLVTIIDGVNVADLPLRLRSVQSFTPSNYQEGILRFMGNLPQIMINGITPIKIDKKIFKIEEDNVIDSSHIPNSPHLSINQHEYVDLGLPSGLLWAKCNIGASCSEEPGDFFAWGEIQTKKGFSLVNYKIPELMNVEKQALSSLLLDVRLDAANHNWGNMWRMPSASEWKELRTYCDMEWFSRNGRNGYLIRSQNNGKSIFLPAAGYRFGPRLLYGNEYGRYWSSSIANDSNEALYLGFNQHSFIVDSFYRYSGYSIRPVITSNEIVPLS